jgi:hypothetical protein
VADEVVVVPPPAVVLKAKDSLAPAASVSSPRAAAAQAAP